MYETYAFGKDSSDGAFKKMTIHRGETGPEDVEFDIKYCGICHSDVHIAENQLKSTKYPVVPGHELAGIVTKVCNSSLFVKDKVGVDLITILGWLQSEEL